MMNKKSISILVPAEDYLVSDDKRLLIPFMENGKIGLMDKAGRVIVNAQYDSILDDCYTANDPVRIGKRSYQAYERKTTAPQVYEYMHYGVFCPNKGWVVEPRFLEVQVSSDHSLLTLRNERGYCVQDLSGNIIVDYGKFSFIDGFYNGLSRVASGSKWGIINEKGNIVLPIMYDKIWNFVGYDGKTIKCQIQKEDNSGLADFDISVASLHSRAQSNQNQHHKQYNSQFDSIVDRDFLDDTYNTMFALDDIPEAWDNIEGRE